jgi:hypothetical protein
VGKGVLKPEGVVKPVTEIMEAIGGMKEIWEAEGKGEEGAADDKFVDIIKKRYRRLMKLESGVKEIVMGKQEEEEGKQTTEGGDDDGGEAMDVQADG